jgi:diguanylate cyclase (GGDEF)-like protein
MRSFSLRKLVHRIGLAVAIAAAISPPAGYLMIGYGDLVNVLDIKTKLNARAVAKYVDSQSDVSQYQYGLERISEALEQTDTDKDQLRKRVINSTGKIILEEGPVVLAPKLLRSAPITVSGTAVGRVEIETSLRPLVVGAGLVGILSCILGCAVYFAMRVLPLKMLDRTVGTLEQTNGRFGAALNNMVQGLLMVDAQQRLVVWNERFITMFQLSPDMFRPLMPLRELFTIGSQNNPLFKDTPAELIAERQRVWDAGISAVRVRELTDGRIISILHAPIPTGGWLTTYEDITERRMSEKRIAHMAHHDALTNLPNRLSFREQMEHALNSIRSGDQLAVLCLDLDHFKDVNDTLGHPIGDDLLRAVGGRLKECIRETDVIARLGGDEFAIVQVETANQPAEATALARRLIEVISAPYKLDGHQIVIGVSVGIALAPTDSVDPDQLLKNSDMALYRAKSDGRGTYHFFEPGMDARVQARRMLELDLRAAIANSEFEMYYQPIVDLETDAIVSVEALVRWHHPRRGMVPPVEFIPLAEETGMIVPIGEWILRQACSEAAKWPRQIRVAVNLSPVQFKNRNLLASVIQAVAAAGLAPTRLELEITESVLLQESAATLATLHSLRSFGVRISMDDFGTGYSSLSYLRSFPFDKIKIDRSFINDLATHNDSMAIVRAVAGLGKSLGIATTAEGVETNEQLTLLRSEGCSEVQGYLFSPPVTAAGIEEFIAASHEQRAVA